MHMSLASHTYVLAQKSDPVWGSQSVNQDSEVGLVKRVGDAHDICIFLHACTQCFVKAHVAMDDAVTPVLVLGQL